MPAKKITVGDLKDQHGERNPAILYCNECGSEFSANAGDYFMHPKDHAFEHCGELMTLIRKRVYFERVEV